MTAVNWLRRASLALGLVLFGLTSARPLLAQRGALTRSRNLGELVSQSAVILRGHVVSVRAEPHPELTNLWTIVVTLRVREVLKGDAGPTFTFRQFIWDIRDRYDAAGYRKGQELLLLMNPTTRYGLSSPVGRCAAKMKTERRIYLAIAGWTGLDLWSVSRRMKSPLPSRSGTFQHPARSPGLGY